MHDAYPRGVKISSSRHLRRMERLQELTQEAGGPAQLGRLSGTPASHISAMLAGNRGMGDQLAAKLEKAMNKPAGWMDEPAAVAPAPFPPGTPVRALRALDGDDTDFPVIRRVRFKLSAGASGFGVEYVDEGQREPIGFRRHWYESRGYDPVKLFSIPVCNGSMEPGLYDGYYVVVNTADTKPKDGEVFAFNYEGELVIKRLVRDEGQWWLVSDNPDKRRYPRKKCTEDVFIIGRIVHKQSERI